MNKELSEVEKIQKILRKPQKEENDLLIAYSGEEKCTAIGAWVEHSGISFDMKFVDSVYNHCMKYGSCTVKQNSALDKIITRFNINVSKWSM